MTTRSDETNGHGQLFTSVLHDRVAIRASHASELHHLLAISSFLKYPSGRTTVNVPHRSTIVDDRRL